MSDLSSFRKDAPKPAHRPSGSIRDFKVPDRPARKGPPDKDRCPAGWDANVWHLVLLFEQAARHDKIELVAGRPVIYAEINDLVTRYDMRQKSERGLYRQEVRGCRRRELGDGMADRCWYHFPPGRRHLDEQEARVLTWVEVVTIIMAEFWSRIQNEYAVDHFRQYFAEYGLAMVNHWKSLRISNAIDDQPKDHVRPVMRRRANGATMARSGKEG